MALGRAPFSAGSFGDVIECGFYIDDRGAIQGLEVLNLKAKRSEDGYDGDAVDADWIGPVLRAGAEDAGEWLGAIVSGMHAQGLAMRAIQPGEEQEAVAHSNATQRFLYFGSEHQLGKR